MNEKQKQIILEALDNPEDLTGYEYDLINKLADKPEGYEIHGGYNGTLNRIAEKLELDL
jgi:hypothetical protein